MKSDTDVSRCTSVNREGETVVYSVPVIRHIWPEPKNDRSQRLVEKIRSAKTEAEVKALVEKGMATQKDVEQSTIDKWKKVAERRIRQLTNTKT